MAAAAVYSPVNLGPVPPAFRRHAVQRIHPYAAGNADSEVMEDANRLLGRLSGFSSASGLEHARFAARCGHSRLWPRPHRAGPAGHGIGRRSVMQGIESPTGSAAAEAGMPAPRTSPRCLETKGPTNQPHRNRLPLGLFPAVRFSPTAGTRPKRLCTQHVGQGTHGSVDVLLGIEGMHRKAQEPRLRNGADDYPVPFPKGADHGLRIDTG